MGGMPSERGRMCCMHGAERGARTDWMDQALYPSKIDDAVARSVEPEGREGSAMIWEGRSINSQDL